MYNVVDKMLVKSLLETVRKSKANEILPDTSRELLFKYLDDDIEQLSGEILLDTVKLKLGDKKDE